MEGVGTSAPSISCRKDPAMPAHPIPIEVRFWSKVEKTDGCWEWKGRKLPKGYGKIGFKGKEEYAHRVSWILHFGEIPRKIQVCHTCDNPSCVRPSHLFLGTNSDNQLDCEMKGRRNRPKDFQVGSSNNKAKLTESDVMEIRIMYASGQYKQKHLAELFGVGETTVTDILIGNKWSHVGGPISQPLAGGKPRSRGKGESNGASKLTEDKVIQIKILYRDKKATQYELADMFGVKRGTISDILRGRNWSHVRIPS